MTGHFRILIIAASAAAIVASYTARAADHAIAVKIAGLSPDGRFPDQAAFCPPAPATANNISPAIEWSKGPEGTRSYALLMTDPDVPADFGQINKAGITIADDAPRISVYHWVLVDIPAVVASLPIAVESGGLVPHGKPVGQTEHGLRGANVYTTFLASNAGMAGVYGGYDGPCPPSNDERVHRYVVRIFALNTAFLGLSGAFDGSAVEKAMRGHVLAEGQATATYTLNPRFFQKPVR